MGSATSVRREAVQRLVDICDAAWDVDLVLARGSIDVLLRKALRATKHDDGLLAEVHDLWPVAKGRTEPLIDAALTGLPDREVIEPVDLADVEAALERMGATA